MPGVGPNPVTLDTMKLAILKNEDPYDHLMWVKACEESAEGHDFTVIDLTDETWLEDIRAYAPDLLLLKPAGKTSLFRALYQERLEILTLSLGYHAFPSLEEVRIYENKRFLSYWLRAHVLPHPETRVFYHSEEAIRAATYMKLPVVGKMNIGASGNGVEILTSRDQLTSYIQRAFSDGLASRTGPKLDQGDLFRRALQKLTHPKELLNRIRTYRDVAGDRQKGFVVLQEFIKHDYEWRAVRMGDSFFAHKKVVAKGKASGSLLKSYDDPPKGLLDLVRSVTDTFNFRSVAIDVFEPEEGEFLINEIQCIFGQSDPHQMIVDGKPGRYVFRDEGWVFEEGVFNTNASYDLRLDAALNRFRSQV